MSLEAFCQAYPPNPELKTLLERVNQGRSGRSLVGFLAEALAKAGGDGLRLLTKRLDQDEVTIVPDQEIINSFPQTERVAIGKHQAAVIFGVSIISIEDALINEEFDFRAWCSLYNLVLEGTPFMKVEYQGSPIQRLERPQLKKMFSYASQDKTLAIFFGEGMFILPSTLTDILNRPPQRLNVINSEIMPLYHPRAMFLI